MRPITAGKCVCDRYTASTKVRPETRICDTGRAQDTRQPGMVAGGERGGSRRPRRPRPQGPLRLKHVAHQKKVALAAYTVAVFKDELFIEKL